MLLRLLFLALGVFGAALAAPALSQSSFTVRVPVVMTAFQPQVQAFDFGTVAVGSRPVRAFQVVNRSTTPLKLLSTSTLGSAVIEANSCPAVLSAGASCQVTVALPVTSAASISGEVRLLNDASTVPEVLRVSALGSAASSLLAVTPGTLSFGDVAVGSASPAQSFTLRNATAAQLHVGELYIAENGTYFPLTSGCPEELAANQSCTVSVRFTPRLEGSQQARLVRDLEDGTTLYVASVSGTGVRAEATWTMTQVDFVGLPVGVKSAIQEVGLTNTGRGALAIGSLTIAGDTAFKLEGHTCGSSLAAGATCVVRLSVTPPDTLVRSATLKLESTSLESRSSLVQLYARPEAQLATLALSPLSVPFGDVAVGATSASQSVTMTATGTLPVAVSALSLSGAQASDFLLLNPNACVGTLNPGQSCVVQLAARPTQARDRLASLSAVSSSARLVEPVTLTVRGIEGQLLAVPSPLSFGEVLVGEQAPRTVTLSNVGAASLTLQTPTFSGPNAALFSSSGCAGQTLAPGANCALTVKYSPTSGGAHAASMTLPNTGAVPGYSVPLSGTARALPQTATLSEFSCPDWTPYNQTATCTATLTNSAATPLTIGALTRGNTAFSVSSTCGTSLAVGATCTLSASVPTGAWTSGATQRTLSSGVTLVTGASTFTRTATVKVDVSSLAWSVAAYEPVATGATGSAVHTLTNTGKFPVRLARAPILEQVTPAGKLVIASSSCGTDLEVGRSCTVTVRCDATTAVAAGTFTARLSAEGSNYAKDADALGCPVFVQVAPSAFRLVPAVLDFGQVGQGAAATRTVTLENDSLVPIPVSAWTVLGAQAPDFSVSAACAKVPARTGTTPGRCTAIVTFRPAATGVRQASVEAIASSLGLRAAGSLVGSGALAVLTSPALDFGSLALGNALQKNLVVTNTGPVAVTLPAAAGWAVSGTHASDFSVNATACAAKALAVGASCTVSASFKPTALAARSAQLTLSASSARTLSVALSGTAVPAPAPVASAGPLSCSSPAAVGGTSSCSLTLSNRGDAALPLQEQPLVSMNVELANLGTTLPAGVSRAARCGSALMSLAAGDSCTYSFTLPVPLAGANTARFQLRLGAYPTLTSTALVQGLAPSAALVTTEHPKTQQGASSVAVHRLTNTAAVPLVLAQTGAKLASVTGTSTIQFTGTPASGKACVSPLAPGDSCQLQTTCTSNTAGRYSGMLVLGTTVSGATVSAPVLCEVTAPTFEVAPAGPLTTVSGAWSDSGNFWRVTNTGAGPLTFVGAYPADDGWTMVVDSRDSTHCKAKATLAPGASCLFLSRLVKAAPDTTVTGLHRVRMASGSQQLDKTFSDSIQSLGVAMSVTKPLRDLQVLNTQVAEVTLVNRAPYPLSQVKVVLFEAAVGYTLLDHSCPAVLAPAGQAGSSCTARVQMMSSTPGPRLAKLRIEGSYPQVVNKLAQSAVRSGVQGRTELSTNVMPARLSVQTTEHEPVLTLYSSAPATHIVRNDGVGDLIFRSATVSAGGFSVRGGTCVADLVLKPGATCTVLTTFTAGRFSPLRTTGVLTATTNAITATGPLVGIQRIQGDVLVNTNILESTVLVGRTTQVSSMIANNSTGQARVEFQLQVSADAPASVTLRGAMRCGYAYSYSNCVISGNKAQLTVAPGGRMWVLQDVAVGQAAGTLRAVGSITVQDVEDTQASNNIDEATASIQYPFADLEVRVAPAARQVGPGAGGELQVTVTNLSTASSSTTPLAALSLSASATASSGASVSLGALRCLKVDTRTASQCAEGGSLSLPPRGSATLALPYVLGNGLGQVSVSVGYQRQGTPFFDPVEANNTGTAVLSVERPTTDFVLTGALSGSGESRAAVFLGSSSPTGTRQRAEFSFTTSNPATNNPTAVDSAQPIRCYEGGKQTWCTYTPSGRIEMWSGMSVYIPLKAGEGTLTVRGTAHDVDLTDSNPGNNVADVEFNGLAAPCNGKFKVLPDESVLCLTSKIVFTQPRYPGCREQCSYKGYVQVSKPRRSFYEPFEFHGNVGRYDEWYSSAPSYMTYGYTRESSKVGPIELDYDWDARTAWYVISGRYSKDIYLWDATCSYHDGSWWSGSANPCNWSHVQGYGTDSYSLVGVRSDGTTVYGGSMCSTATGFRFNMTARTLSFSGCPTSSGMLTVPR